MNNITEHNALIVDNPSVKMYVNFLSDMLEAKIKIIRVLDSEVSLLRSLRKTWWRHLIFFGLWLAIMCGMVVPIGTKNDLSWVSAFELAVAIAFGIEFFFMCWLEWSNRKDNRKLREKKQKVEDQIVELQVDHENKLLSIYTDPLELVISISEFLNMWLSYREGEAKYKLKTEFETERIQNEIVYKAALESAENIQPQFSEVLSSTYGNSNLVNGELIRGRLIEAVQNRASLIRKAVDHKLALANEHEQLLTKLGDDIDSAKNSIERLSSFGNSIAEVQQIKKMGEFSDAEYTEIKNWFFEVLNKKLQFISAQIDRIQINLTSLKQNQPELCSILKIQESDYQPSLLTA